MVSLIQPNISEWKKVRFDDVAEFINGRAYKATEFKEEGTPIVRIQNLTGTGKTVYSDLELPENKYIEYGDLIYAWSATFGPYIWKGEKSIFHYHIWKVICDQDIIEKYYFYYYLMNISDRLKESGNGTLFVHITKALMESFELFIPTLKEQKAIAEVLSSLDDKIDLLHRQNQTLEALAETLFRHTFIDNAQDNWETVKLGDVVDTNTSTIKKDYEHNIIQYLDTGSITRNFVDGYQEVALNEAPSRAKRLVNHNDIIISTVRPNQEHYGIIKNPIDNLVVSTGFCVITCKKIDPHFAYIFLTSDEMTEHLHVLAEASTSTYPSLKPLDIEGLEFKMPPKALLDDFAQIADGHWQKIEANHREIKTFENLRDTLLPKLMSGDIRVQYDETSQTEAA